MHRLLKNENGYSFIESMFQLIILAVYLHFVILFFLWKAPIERQIGDYFATEWELFAIDLQNLLVEVERFDVLVGNRSIVFSTERGIIRVEQSPNGTVIRKQVNGDGHISMFTNVAASTFTQHGHLLHMEVSMIDGKKREKWLAIGQRPE